jgi:hypothetical protein
MHDFVDEYVVIDPEVNGEEVNRILLDPTIPIAKAVAEVVRRGLAVKVNRESDA